MNRPINPSVNSQNVFCGQQNMNRPPNLGFYGGRQPMENNPNQFCNQFTAQSQQYFGRMQFPNGFQNHSPNRNNVGCNMNNNRPTVNNIWAMPHHNINRPHNNAPLPQYYQNCNNMQQRCDREFQNGNPNKNQQQINRGFPQKSHSKQNKLDKRNLAENNVFYCDICDRGFKTKDIYTEHNNNHQKCRVDGCSYVAAPKLVNLHFNMQHRTGYAKKIWSLESKEDIENWIQARKRNFPTASNIAQKNLIKEEKRSRGEILETKQFGKMKGRGRNNNNNNNIKRKTENSDENHCNKKVKRNSSPDIKDKRNITDHKEDKLQNLDDPLAIILDSNNKSSDMSNHMSNEESNSSFGLTSILSCYGDDSDSGEEEELVLDKEDCFNRIESLPPAKNNINENEEDGVKEDNNNNNRKNNRRKRTKRCDRYVQTIKKKPTLLEMLLANEIRNERNVILQCVFYMVKKQFFNKDDGYLVHKETVLQ